MAVEVVLRGSRCGGKRRANQSKQERNQGAPGAKARDDFGRLFGSDRSHALIQGRLRLGLTPGGKARHFGVAQLAKALPDGRANSSCARAKRAETCTPKRAFHGALGAVAATDRGVVGRKLLEALAAEREFPVAFRVHYGSAGRQGPAGLSRRLPRTGTAHAAVDRADLARRRAARIFWSPSPEG